jgi:hypothetical protein
VTKDPTHENAIDPVSTGHHSDSRYFDYDETPESNPTGQFFRPEDGGAAYCESVDCTVIPNLSLPQPKRVGARLDFTIGWIFNWDINGELTTSMENPSDIELTATNNLELGPIGWGLNIGPVIYWQESEEDPSVLSLALPEAGMSLAAGPGIEFGHAFDQNGEHLLTFVGAGIGTSAGIGYVDVIGLTVNVNALLNWFSR